MFSIEEDDNDDGIEEGVKRKLGFWGVNNNGDDINGGKGSWPSIFLVVRVFFDEKTCERKRK